ncbi:elongator complex protein 4 [Nasonia vitripennis]|uniref:Elongator complex protein 4 n=1 Tax=Nasonia vitripennis TaxID=7425 RepID=A0A7M7Q702_NASVI|nr:elongator complex protein 4 [Nasonia vitripennis]XP_031780901.1 elongator complex protein 4 [Nasonia vitripennis]
MSSNVKIAKAQMPIIPGTKPATRNAQLLVSTGIPSLDHFIGGGLPIGSILLIEEDAYSTYAKVMYRYFIAEGIVNSHSLFVASQDLKPSHILGELPAVDEESIKKHDSFTTDEEMKIAWRYQNMKVFDSSPGDSSTFGHYYDLTKKMKKETLERVNMTTWDGENVKKQNGIFENDAYMDLLLNIEKTLTEGQFLIAQTATKRNLLRIAINSLGSRLWLGDSEEQTQSDLLKFLYMFRALLRESFAVAVLTVPVLNFDDYSTGIVQRIEHMTDVVISLESFAGSTKETNPIFKDYHGLLHIKKLPAFNTLVNQESLFSDLAFKLRRKKFLIEILHLPPELGETTQREQDDVGCSGAASSGRSKLDF